MEEGSNVVRFPVQLRVVPVPPPSETSVELVDHDGRLFALHQLLERLSVAHRIELDAAMPRTGQEAWDLVVRCWPKVARAIIADVAARR